MARPGEIWWDKSYYVDKLTGEIKGKFFLILAVDGGDVVYRLLTSRQHGRPVKPACSHDDPYPGFYLGILGGPLSKESWLDLSETEDIEEAFMKKWPPSGRLSFVAQLPAPLFCSALACVANAPDTTRRQEKAIYAVRRQLNCP